MRTYFYLILTILTLFSCVSKQRESELLEKIAELENQLENCEYGAEKIHAKMKISYENKDFQTCKDLYSEMTKRHPESKLYLEVKQIYDKIIKLEKEKAEKERLLAEKEKLKKLTALKKLKKNYDDVSGITWYTNPYFTHYESENLMSIYIGHNSSSTWLRLKMSYYGSDWIFFERAYLSYDGNTKEIFFNEYVDKKTENSGGGVWEWIDIIVPSELEEYLKDFAQSKNAKMRLSGKYSRTRQLTWKERQGIIDILSGYEILKAGINSN
jgi:hypothetical protein